MRASQRIRHRPSASPTGFLMLYDASVNHDSHPSPFLQPKLPGYLVRLVGVDGLALQKTSMGEAMLRVISVYEYHKVR